MTPTELIEAAYAFEISEEEKLEAFDVLCERMRLEFEDQDRRFTMMPEDVNVVYTL